VEETVFVVDADQCCGEHVAAGVRTLGTEVVAMSSGERLLEDPEAEEAGCVILEVDLPGASGPEIQREMLERGWIAPVLFVTGRGEVEVCARVMRAGSLDFLTKPVREGLLLRRVRAALEMSRVRRAARRDESFARSCLARLSRREYEVLGLLVQGMASRRIAEVLHLSQSTVDNHRHRIMTKMQAENAAQLVWLATIGSGVGGRPRPGAGEEK